MAKRFALSGAALVVFGLYLSWPLGFSWRAVVASTAALAAGGTGWRLAVFVLAAGAVAMLLRPRFPAAAEWAGSLAALALLYPLFGLAAGLPELGGWPGMFVSVGAICAAAGGSAWLVGAACRSGARLASWLGAFGPRAGLSGAAGQPAPDAAGRDGAPTCPRCGAPMKLRAARQGKNAGQAFWGCTRYPKCQTMHPA